MADPTAAPAAAPAAPMASSISVAVQAALATIQLDALGSFGPVLLGVLTKVQANPALVTDPTNFVLQGGVIEAELVGAFPGFEQQVVKDLAAQLQALLTAFSSAYQAKLQGQQAA